jgi:hypothetical protein
VHAEKRLGGKAERAQGGQCLEQQVEAGVSAETNDRGHERDEDEAAPRHAAVDRSHARQYESRRAQVHAEQIGEALAEAGAQETVGQAGGGAVETGDHRLQERHGVEGEGQGGSRGEALLSLAALERMGDHRQRRCGEPGAQDSDGTEAEPTGGVVPAGRQRDSDDKRLRHDLEPQGGQRDRRRRRGDRDTGPRPVRRPQREPHDQRRPGHGLQEEIEVQAGEREAAQGIDQRTGGCARQGEAERTSQGNERQCGQGHMQGQQQRKAPVVAGEDLEGVQRVGDRRQAEGLAFVDVRVPEAQLPRAQPFDRELPHGEEMARDVAIVESPAAEHSPGERQETDQRQRRGESQLDRAARARSPLLRKRPGRGIQGGDMIQQALRAVARVDRRTQPSAAVVVSITRPTWSSVNRGWSGSRSRVAATRSVTG